MALPFPLIGRTVLITGASSGIGARLSRVFSEAGARVVLGARRTDLTEELAAELRAKGGEALAVLMDVTDNASIVAAYDVAEQAFGPVGTIIANAGTASGGRSTELDTKAIRAVPPDRAWSNTC